jgi:hypothetical protein
VRYQGVTTTLKSGGANRDTGYDGTSLFFSASSPRFNTAAKYLFVSGGGQLRKLDTSQAASKWGIAPPVDLTAFEVSSADVDPDFEGGGDGDDTGFESTTSDLGDFETDFDGWALKRVLDGTSDRGLERGPSFVDGVAVVSSPGSGSNIAFCSAKGQIRDVDTEDGQDTERDYPIVEINKTGAFDFTTLGGAPSSENDGFSFDVYATAPVHITVDINESVSGRFFDLRAMVAREPLHAGEIGTPHGDPHNWYTVFVPKRAFRSFDGTNRSSLWANVTEIVIRFNWQRFSGTFGIDNINFASGPVGHETSAPDDVKPPTEVSAEGTFTDNVTDGYLYEVTYYNSVTGNRSNGSQTLVAAAIAIDQRNLSALPIPNGSLTANTRFQGTGLDDLTAGGTNTDDDSKIFMVEIDATGTPDTFKWSRILNNENDRAVEVATGVAITGAAQTLETGVTVTFGATTGHTLGDRWVFGAQPNDSQITGREIWRTVKDGVRRFRIARINNITDTTFTDRVQDSSEINFDPSDPIMTPEELPTDNGVPDAEFDTHVIQAVTSFWSTTRTGEQGRVYISPSGRPESKKLFIEVSNPDDPIQNIVIHAGQRYAFSEAKVWRIDGGQNDLYVPREVPGVPGVPAANRQTVTSTPYGIGYVAHDGPRLLTGGGSRLLGEEQLGVLFRGEAPEGTNVLAAFEPERGTYGRSELYFSDNGNTVLAYNIQAGTWRDLGLTDVSAMYYEWDTDKLVMARTSATELVEEEGDTTDASGTKTFVIEPPAVSLPDDQLFLFEELYVEYLSSQALTPTIRSSDQAAVALSNLAASATRTSTRTAINRFFKNPSVELAAAAAVDGAITVYDIQYGLIPTEIGVSVDGQPGNRVAIMGRSLDLSSQITFQIHPDDLRVTLENRLFNLSRIVIDHEGAMTPVITDVDGSTLSLAATSGAGRHFTEIDINRPFELAQIHFTGDFTAAANVFYGAELYLSPLELGINGDGKGGQRKAVSGRSVALDTQITFEVQTSDRSLDTYNQVYIVNRLVVDHAGAMTPTITGRTAGAVALSATSGAGRHNTEIEVDRLMQLDQVHFAADFTTGANVLYGAELYLSPLEMGVRIESAPDNRLVVLGRSVALDTQITFEVHTDDHRLNDLSKVWILERMVLDYDGVMTPVITTIGGNTHSLAATSGTGRQSVEYDLRRAIMVNQVHFTGDFTNSANVLYGVELYIRPLNPKFTVVGRSQ